MAEQLVRQDIFYNYTDGGSSAKVAGSTKQLIDRENELIITEKTLQKTGADGNAVWETRRQVTKEVGLDEKILQKEIRSSTMQLQQMNIAVLGVNMSFLGLSFNMRNLGFVSDETAEALQQMIAPIQMVMTFMNLGLAMNILYKQSLDATRASMVALTASMLGIGFIISGMSTKIPALRALMFAMAGVTTLWALATWNLTAAKLAFLGSNPLTWGILAAAIAIIAGSTGFITAQKARNRAFAGGILSRGTLSVGERAEMIVPLQSPRAMTMGATGTSRPITIAQANFNIRASNEREFYREMKSATQRMQFASG